MLLGTLETVPGKKITKHLGLVQRNTISSKHVGRDMMASLKNIFGGELKSYTEFLHESSGEKLSKGW